MVNDNSLAGHTYLRRGKTPEVPLEYSISTIGCLGAGRGSGEAAVGEACCVEHWVGDGD